MDCFLISTFFNIHTGEPLLLKNIRRNFGNDLIFHNSITKTMPNNEKSCIDNKLFGERKTLLNNEVIAKCEPVVASNEKTWYKRSVLDVLERKCSKLVTNNQRKSFQDIYYEIYFKNNSYCQVSRSWKFNRRYEKESYWAILLF